jgi:vacuolar-type H+-ATPase subunit F/Vma7
MSKDILIAGKRETVLGFRSIGQETLFWDSQDIDPKEGLKEKINDGVKIVFITEDIFKDLEGFIELYQDKLYPMFIVIPSIEGNQGIGYQNIEKLIVQALGTGSANE